MKILKSIVFVGSLSLGFNLALAQIGPATAGPPGAQNNPQIKSPTQAKQASMLKYISPVPRWALIAMPDVRKELNVDDDEYKMSALAAIKENRPDFKPSGDPEGQWKRWNHNMDESFMKGMSGVQKSRAEELWIQYNGALTVMEYPVAKQLDLSDQQRAEVAAVVAAGNKQLRDEEAKKKKGEKIDKLIDFKKLTDECSMKIVTLLKAPQLEKLKALGGKVFKFASTQNKVKSGN